MSHSTTILSLDRIKTYLTSVDLIPLIEEGFKAYSLGNSVVPPVGELIFENPPGDTHIKYGYIKDQPYYVVKIASGFYDNPILGLKASQGVLLLFSQRTGELKSVLLDEGHLTDIRTVVASMITLKHFAPSDTEHVGIVGTGIQARLQLEYLQTVGNYKSIHVWGRSQDKGEKMIKELSHLPYSFTLSPNIQSLAKFCKTIITTTASKEPLLKHEDLMSGAHITSLGSDTAHKVELHSDIIAHADIVISDSFPQSEGRGEVYQARQAKTLNQDKLVELGQALLHPEKRRQNNNQLTVADLTGVAVQDIMIATAIYNHHLKQNHPS